LEFNVPFQHKYGYIRDDTESGNNKQFLQENTCEFLLGLLLQRAFLLSILLYTRLFIMSGPV